MSRPINIGEPIAEICKRLGLEPNDVGRINFFPTDLEAFVFERNEAGEKHVKLDANGNPTNDVAAHWQRFKVRT